MDSGDNAWLLTSAALVLFMTPGLAFFYGGMVRSKNTLNMLMMNFWCLLVVPLLWAIVGYSLAFSGDGDFIGNFDKSFMRNFDMQGNELMFMIFLATFAAITPALISGAVADRMKFSAWAIFVPLWSILVYCPVTFWVYPGWLAERGSVDFAGGTSIHVNAGIGALAVILVLGKRKGWPEKLSPPHSMPLVMLGTGILWVGWFGFNAGSAGAANGRAIQAFVNTALAAAAAGLSWAVTEKFRDGHFTNLGVASGIVAGLVAITPGCGFVTGGSSILIGLIAGVVCALAVGLKSKLGYDDALDVIGVHLVGGLLGSILIGFFADPEAFSKIDEGYEFLGGLFYGGGTELLVEQILANVVTLIFSFAVTFAIAKVLDLTIGLRVSEEVESEGLDIREHAETAYSSLDRSTI
ncbi:MAG TPA: ammonium transporter [Microthrixaceae bacterium]|nr:ammonium transporter [Microthrixaceae bacterium]